MYWKRPKLNACTHADEHIIFFAREFWTINIDCTGKYALVTIKAVTRSTDINYSNEAVVEVHPEKCSRDGFVVLHRPPDCVPDQTLEVGARLIIVARAQRSRRRS